LIATASNAATIATGVTAVGDGGGSDLVGTDVAVPATNTDQNLADIPDAEYVWGPDTSAFSEAEFAFAFDLTGWDVTTVVLSGVLAVDNTALVQLNGSTIANFDQIVTGNFLTPNPYGTTDTTLFADGSNVLTFSVADRGAPLAFAANVEVTGDPLGAAVVPLPASLPLVLAGLGALGLLRSRARRDD
jgi:hypothetical protein